MLETLRSTVSDPLVSFVWGVATLVIGIFLSIHIYKLQEKSSQTRVFTSDNMLAGVRRLAHKVRGFDPQIIFACDSRGGLWADLLAETLNTRAPIFVGTRFYRLGRIFSRRKQTNSYTMAQVGLRFSKTSVTANSVYLEKTCKRLETGRWIIYIPYGLKELNQSRILVADDYSYTGETMSLIKKSLIEDFGFEPNNIRTLTVITTKHARILGQQPDFSDVEVDKDEFRLPYMERE